MMDTSGVPFTNADAFTTRTSVPGHDNPLIVALLGNFAPNTGSRTVMSAGR